MSTVAVPLGELAEVVSGGTPRRSQAEFFGGAIPWVKIGDMLQGTVIHTDEQITRAGLDNSSAKLLPAGTILLSIFATIGRTAVLGVDAATNQAIAGLKIRDSACVHPSYLRCYLEFAAPGLARQGRGVAQANINLSILRAHSVPLPPMEEQRRIATMLDAAEALRAKRREALTKLDDLTPAIFHDLFGDPVRNERGWPIHSLREACSRIQIGPFGSLLHKSDYIEGGVPLVNPMHIIGGAIKPHREQTISSQKYGELKPYRMQKGDVVMGRRGEMGRAAIVGKDEAGFICGSGSLYMRPDPDYITPQFMAAALSSARGRRHLENSAQGVTMLNLNSDIVGSFVLGLPPVELQREFCAKLTAQGELKAKLLDHATALDQLSASLQQRAFRGEL